MSEFPQPEARELLKLRDPGSRRISRETADILSCLAFHSARGESLSASQIIACRGKLPGSVYLSLDTLEEKGLVSVIPVKQEGSMGRRYIAEYKLVDVELCEAIVPPEMCLSENHTSSVE